MKSTKASFLVCLFVLWMFIANAQNSTSIFKAGFSEKDITPDIGMEAPGGYGKSYHTYFNDRCKVRAAVFDDGKKHVALVGLDLAAVTRDIVIAARAEIHQRCGIEPGAIMIGASHSHSSGPSGDVESGGYADASSKVKDLANNKSISADPGFVQHLKHQIVEAVLQANANRTDAKLAVGIGHEDKVSFNRRLRMKNGLTYTHPRPGNPNIIDYAGPIDPDVGTIGVWDIDDNLLGVVVNFACHATTNPGGISANWIATMENTLRGATGNEALPVVFLQGASGDITQVDNMAKHTNPGSREWWELVGGRVGAEAYKTLLLVHRGAGNNIPLDYRQKVWSIDRRVPAPEKVKRALEIVVQDPETVGDVEWDFAKEIVLLDALNKIKPQAEVEVQTIQVGPIVLVSSPAEYFVEYGLDIKKESNFPFTFVVGLANGIVGYVPTEEAFGPHGGGYETRLTSYSNLEVSAGRQIADTGLNLAKEMMPGEVPLPPTPPEFTSPWLYGNIAPELD